MAESKGDTTLTVSAIKKMEAEYLQRKEAFKSTLLAQGAEIVKQLAELDFEFEFVEKSAVPKKRIGRPPKVAPEVANQ